MLFLPGKNCTNKETHYEEAKRSLIKLKMDIADGSESLGSSIKVESEPY